MRKQNDVLTEKETAEYITTSPSFLRQDRMNGIKKNLTPGPNFLKINRMIRYLKEDIDNWLFHYRIERSC